MAELQADLENRIQARTGGRIRNFQVDLYPERIVLRGKTSTFYVKQLAQHGVREVFPEVSLENAIMVD